MIVLYLNYLAASVVPKKPSEVKSDSSIIYHQRMDPVGLHPVLSQGRYVWPISFKIPSVSPPTFAGATTIPFKVIHWIRVLIRQNGVLVNNDVDTIASFEVRAQVSPAMINELPYPQTQFIEKLERAFWRSAGTLGVLANFSHNILVAGDYCNVQVELDMRMAELMIEKIELRLVQRVVTVNSTDSNWEKNILARSDPNMEAENISPQGQVHPLLLRLLIPKNLETSPTITTEKGGCEYYVMLHIKPESGSNIRRLFRLPLTCASSVRLSRPPTPSAPPSVQYDNGPSSPVGPPPVPTNYEVPSYLETLGQAPPDQPPPAYTPPVFQ